jgi:hypothetical protein
MLFSERVLRSAVASDLAYSDMCAGSMGSMGSRGSRGRKVAPQVQVQKQQQHWPVRESLVGGDGDGTGAGGAGGGRRITCVRADTYVRAGVRAGPDAIATSSRAYAWRSGDAALTVAFRGSVGSGDIARFLDMKRVDFGFREHKVQVHAGLLRTFRELERPLTRLILPDAAIAMHPDSDGEEEEAEADADAEAHADADADAEAHAHARIRTRPRHLTFTGHSLGGALALFAAAYYASLTDGRADVACHVFGAFRPGDAAFRDWYQRVVGESVVLCNRDDLVAQLPPKCLGYADVKGHHVFSDDRLSRSEGVDPIAPHRMSTYIDYLCAGAHPPRR